MTQSNQLALATRGRSIERAGLHGWRHGQGTLLPSQSGCSLTATAGTQAGKRVCRPSNRGSPTGTASAAARRDLLPGLDGGPVLRAAGARPCRLCRTLRLPGGRHLQGNRVRGEARPGRAAQGAGAGAAARDRRGAGDGAVRWGRSTTDLLATLKELEARRVSLVALNGMAFDLTTPHGRMMATLLAGIAEFERELIVERIRSGIAAARARGKTLGRQPGQRPKSDRLAPRVLALVALGRSYRLIGREVGLSKNTVGGIIKRQRSLLN